jgi:hypothetical protein
MATTEGASPIDEGVAEYTEWAVGNPTFGNIQLPSHETATGDVESMKVKRKVSRKAVLIAIAAAILVALSISLPLTLIRETATSSSSTPETLPCVTIPSPNSAITYTTSATLDDLYSLAQDLFHLQLVNFNSTDVSFRVSSNGTVAQVAVEASAAIVALFDNAFQARANDTGTPLEDSVAVEAPAISNCSVSRISYLSLQADDQEFLECYLWAKQNLSFPNMDAVLSRTEEGRLLVTLVADKGYIIDDLMHAAQAGTLNNTCELFGSTSTRPDQPLFFVVSELGYDKALAREPDTPAQLEWVDINGDGVLDLLVMDKGRHSSTWLANLP